jgi:hypothetical protein
VATRIHRNKGEQFLDANGDPLDGGKLFYYRATTLTPQHTFFAADGLIGNANTNPVVLGSDGRLQTPVYLGDSDSYLDYKEILTTSGNVTVDPWPFDNIPAALPSESGTDFSPPLFEWIQTTEPTVNLAAADAGNAYEVDSTAGNITINLPSAASVGNGKGFAFKKAVGANSIIIDPSGSELLDGSSSQYFMGTFMQTKVISSNGAAWFTVDEYLDKNIFKLINGLTADATPDRAADFIVTYDTSASAEKKVLIDNLIVPGTLIAIIVDRKAANTVAQTIASASDTTRTLNTLDYNRNSLVSLAGGTTGTGGTANQFALPAGNWEIRWSAPAYQTGGHQSILRDVTGAADLVRGTSEVAANNTASNRSFGVWRVSPSASNTYEIRHRAGVANTGGANLNLGVEVYTRVEIYAA